MLLIRAIGRYENLEGGVVMCQAYPSPNVSTQTAKQIDKHLKKLYLIIRNTVVLVHLYLLLQVVFQDIESFSLLEVHRFCNQGEGKH